MCQAYKKYIKIEIIIYLHSVLFFVWRLTLSSSKILSHKGFIKWTINHRVLFNSFLSEIRHHILYSWLSHRLSPLFRNFVHLLQIFFSSWIQFDPKAFLSLIHNRSSFWLRNLVMFKTISHGLIHHTFPIGWNLLQSVDLHIVQVTGTVQISLFVSHHLFEKHVTSCFSLLFLQQQVISRCYLVMFVILNVCYSLI